ncbi:hypothetical protein DFH09DRAFT_1090795 [Mycena vulgaris]|nr:hypothetical protein DFH09DRAFT_1090795 [Mycena vulgaris]
MAWIYALTLCCADESVCLFLLGETRSHDLVTPDASPSCVDYGCMKPNSNDGLMFSELSRLPESLPHFSYRELEIWCGWFFYHHIHAGVVGLRHGFPPDSPHRSFQDPGFLPDQLMHPVPNQSPTEKNVLRA